MPWNESRASDELLMLIARDEHHEWIALQKTQLCPVRRVSALDERSPNPLRHDSQSRGGEVFRIHGDALVVHENHHDLKELAFRNLAKRGQPRTQF